MNVSINVDCPEVDEAAGDVLMTLPEDFIEQHAGTFATAITDTGWTLEDARWYHDLRDLATGTPTAVDRPWKALEHAVRATMTGAERAAALQALGTFRTVLAGVREDDAWAFSDLSDDFDTSAPSYAPGPLADRVVYAEGLTTFVGHGGCGKSTIAQAIALDAIRAGVFVVHLDWEQGQRAVLRKYVQLGATMAELKGNLGYVWQPGAVTIDRLRQLVDGRPALVLVDSFSKAAAAAGLSGTDWQGHGTFANNLNAFGVEMGCPVVLIDHRAKRDGKGTRWADGAHGKYDAASAQWNVDVSRRFDERTPGEVVMTRVKARHGGLDTHARIALGGDGLDRIRLRRVAKGDAPALKVERDVIAFLRAAGGPLTMTSIEKADGVEGKATVIREAVKRLAADEDSPVCEVRGSRYPRYALRDGSNG